MGEAAAQVPEPGTAGAGPFFEDFEIGEVTRSRLGRTVSEADNTWFTCLTLNTNQLHFNAHYATQTRFGCPLVNSCLTLSLVVGLSVPDTSESAVANLGWSEVRLPKPVFVGDTLWAETEVLGLRESRSTPEAGLVDVRTRGINQRGEVVIEFLRTFMAPRRGADVPEQPVTTEPWGVGITDPKGDSG
jgi:itaconyl-CoA hydratase